MSSETEQIAAKSNESFLTMFQILKEHGFDPHAMTEEERTHITQLLLADNATEFKFEPTIKVCGDIWCDLLRTVDHSCRGVSAGRFPNGSILSGIAKRQPSLAQVQVHRRQGP
jgi:hypothetical protein